MTASIPKLEPDQIIAGTSVVWTKTLTDYPASDWTLTYNFVGMNGAFSVTAEADGDDYSISIDPATSADYEPGDYDWASFVSKEVNKVVTERYLITQGSITVLQDPSTIVAGIDNRTHAEKVLDSINLLLEGKALQDSQQYTIAGRSIVLMSIRDLLQWKDYYLLEVKHEQDAERIAKGEKPGNKILPRFGNFGSADLFWPFVK